MSTAYNFTAVSEPTGQPISWNPGVSYTQEFQFTYATTVVVGDTITTPTAGLPVNGFSIQDVEVVCYPPLDTNATPTTTVSVGDSGSSTRFINAAVNGGATWASGSNRINQATVTTNGAVSAGVGYNYNQTTPVALILTVGGTVATSGTNPFVRMKVTYKCTAPQ